MQISKNRIKQIIKEEIDLYEKKMQEEQDINEATLDLSEPDALAKLEPAVDNVTDVIFDELEDEAEELEGLSTNALVQLVAAKLAAMKT